MSNENNTINESKMRASQQKAWTAHRHLYLINKGSVWRAFNESAYVLSALLHYKVTRRMKKKDTTFFDSVTFRTVSLEKVLSKISTDGGEIVKREERKITYRWNKDVSVPEEFSVDRGKDIPMNLRIDEETLSALKKITVNGGFGGKEKATDSEIIRFAIKHFYDKKPIDPKEAEPLIWAISKNRSMLDKSLETLSRLVRELNAIGVNFNQVVHRINYVQQKAIEDGENLYDVGDELLRFGGEVAGSYADISELTEKIKAEMEPAMTAVLTALEGENEIMNRLLL